VARGVVRGAGVGAAGGGAAAGARGRGEPAHCCWGLDWMCGGFWLSRSSRVGETALGCVWIRRLVA
jgi:hypothetical protein